MVKPLNFKLVFDYCLILLPLFFLENIPLVKAIPITPTINKPIAKYNMANDSPLASDVAACCIEDDMSCNFCCYLLLFQHKTVLKLPIEKFHY